VGELEKLVKNGRVGILNGGVDARRIAIDRPVVGSRSEPCLSRIGVRSGER